MKKIIRFSKFFLPAVILSGIIALAGLAGYVYFGHLDSSGKFDLSVKGRNGFNLGVDFQAGLMQEVQFAPAAFSITWSGMGNARLSFDRSALYIVISGAGVESRTYPFPFSEYANAGVLAEALASQVEGLAADLSAPADTNSQWLVYSAQGSPELGSAPYVVHYLTPDSEEIPLIRVRDALTSLGETVSVQRMGQPSDRHFMIRVEDRAAEGAEDGDAAAESIALSTEKITAMLEDYFGSGKVVVIRSDYVGSRFSKNLTDQAGLLLGLTLLLIFAYASIRFRPQYAIGAVLAIVHDALIMIAFVVWTRMEFTTSTIAAILTILGYSINDTIVIFDRIRETRRIYPDDVFVDVLDRSLTETLSRTIITTVTTMLAVVFLFVFTSGSMKDFALVLLVGMVSGVYSTIFIASGLVNLWGRKKVRREKTKIAGTAPVKVPV